MEVNTSFTAEDCSSLSCFQHDYQNVENCKYHLLHSQENQMAGQLQSSIQKIQAKESSFYKRPTNILANRCTYCHVNPKIYEMLEQEGMESLPEGHCYGVSLFFIKFFLEHPDKLYLPLKDLLQEFLEDSRFEQLSHEFQKLQHSYLSKKGEKQPLELNIAAMKKYFFILAGHKVKNYLPITKDVLQDQDLKDTLENFLRAEKNRILMVGVRSKQGLGHCIVVSLKDDNLIIYNSNSGLYRFIGLAEVKEYLLGYFSLMPPTWVASFSPDPQQVQNL